jgi:protein subunit release factor A
MNKVGELVISAQEFRTQKQNKELCLTKLREMVAEAYIEPKDRNMWTVYF